MNRKEWKQFVQLREKCYLDMAGIKRDQECWNQAFVVFRKLVDEMKSEQSDGKIELYQIDDITDFEYDVQGWLEDYLDEIDMRGQYGQLLEVCDMLLEIFAWEEDTPSDIRFRKASVLGSLKRYEEAAEYCRKWLSEEPDNISAVTAGIYASLNLHDMKTAEQLIQKHISEDTECTDENDILFTAASIYYKAAGKKKEKKRIDQAVEAYERYLEELWTGDDGDIDDEFIWGDGDLPF